MKKEVKKNKYINPEPCLIISCRDNDGRDNALSIGFAANVSFNPQIIMIAVMEERYSHHIIKERGEFVVNIPTKQQSSLVEYMGRFSGRNMDKLKDVKTCDADIVDAPLIVECPVNYECRVIETIKPGTHEVFFGKVVKAHCDEEYLTDDDLINWEKFVPLDSMDEFVDS